MANDTFRFMNTTDVKIIVDSDDTEGRTAVFAETVPPGYGPPPHMHVNEMEHIVPIAGNFERFDGKAWGVIPKEGFFVPQGTIHTWRNVGEGDGTILSIFTPGGFDKVMREVANLNFGADMAQVMELTAKAGTIICVGDDDPTVPEPRTPAT